MKKTIFTIIIITLCGVISAQTKCNQPTLQSLPPENASAIQRPNTDTIRRQPERQNRQFLTFRQNAQQKAINSVENRD